MEKSNGKAVATLILGIISLIMIFTGVGSVAGIILAIVGVVLGNQVKRVDPSNGMAKAGRVLCWIGLILCIIVAILLFAACGLIVSLI